MAQVQVLNKKGNVAGLISFVAITIIVLMLAPVLLKIITVPLNKYAEAVAPISNESATAVTYGYTKINSLFDMVIVIAFIFNLMLLLLSSFMIDIHPAFLIVYVIAGFVLFMFMPTFETLIGAFYSNAAFSDVLVNLPMSNFIYQNFGYIMLGVFVLSGVIMFAKFKGSNQGGSNGY